CGRCGRRAPGYDRRRLCYWRHLALGRFRLWLAYAPRRVACPGCGVTTEEVPWASSVIRFTWQFEEMTAYLAEITDRTTVTKMMGVAWRAVGRIVERVIERRVDSSRLEGLRAIGVDELSCRRRHHDLTVVVDHDRRRIVWAKEGRSCEVLKSFFQELGIDRCFNTKTVTIDMAAGYRKAIEEWLPQAEIVFDRFHVQRLASEALEEVRRSIVRELGGSPEAKQVKGTRFLVLEKPEDLSRSEKEKLSAIQETHQDLHRANLLKETLGDALDYREPARARSALRDSLAWASRSRLQPFVRAARTIRKHFEGLISKLRRIARRAFGFHGSEPLIAIFFLACGGMQLDPRSREPPMCQEKPFSSGFPARK
ncbi:MAG: ISL3 family transposase, partial [Planctomycetota bacterium]